MSVEVMPRRLGFAAYLTCLGGIAWREVLRFLVIHFRRRLSTGPRRVDHSALSDLRSL